MWCSHWKWWLRFPSRAQGRKVSGSYVALRSSGLSSKVCGVVGRIGGLFRGRRGAALRFGDGHGRRETSFAVGLNPAGGQRGRCWRHDSIGGVEGGIDDIARGRTRALDATRKALGGRRSKWGRAWWNPEREKAPTEAASSSDFPSRSPSVHVLQSPTTPRMPRGGTTVERFDAFAI